MGSIADHNRINFRFLAVFSGIFGFGICDELVIESVLDQVDGTATESAAHDPTACDAIFFGNVVQEVKFLARHLILLAQSLMGLVHLLPHSLVIAFLQGIAHG